MGFFNVKALMNTSNEKSETRHFLPGIRVSLTPRVAFFMDVSMLVLAIAILIPFIALAIFAGDWLPLIIFAITFAIGFSMARWIR